MSDSGELRRLARGGMGGMLGSLITGLAGLAFILIAARSFPKAEVGIVFTLTSLFLIALAVVTLGSDTGLVRFLAMRIADGRREDVGAVVSTTLTPVLLLSSLAAAGLWFLIPLWAPEGDVYSTARVFAIFLPFAALSNLTLAGTRGLGSIRPTVIVESLVRQGLQPVLALLVALLGLPVSWLALAWVTPYAISGLAGSVLLHRQCRRRGIEPWTRPWSSEARVIGRELWGFNGPRAVTQIAQIGMRRADIPIVTALAGPAAAAVFTAASRFVAAGLQGIRGIQQMVAPQLARLVGAGRIDVASLALRTATTWNVTIAWPLYLACAVAPDVVMGLFGPGYESGVPVVVILALGMLVGIAAGPVDIALLMLGRSGQSLRNNMAALVTHVVLSLLLIPVLGITGAALAWSAAIVVSNALPTWQVRPVLGLAGDRRTLLAASLAVSTFAIIPLLGRLAGWDSVAAQITLVVMAGVVYLGLLARFRHTLRVVELVSAVRRRRAS